MSVIGLLHRLKSLNIGVRIQDGHLKLSAPEGRLDAGLLAELNAGKEDLLTFLKKINTDYQPIPRAEEQPDYPLSYAQKRIWIFEQLQPGTAVYKIAVSLHLQEDINRRSLDRSFAALLQRHESLRTVFVVNNGEPRQKILSVAACGSKVIYEDVRQEPDPIKAALEIARQETLRPFDLEKGPLIRIHLVEIADKENYLMLNLHHIISDGWSMDNLMEELFALYSACDSGRPDPLLPLPLQYKDYVISQRTQLAGTELLQHHAFWLDQLSGELPVLNLYAPKPRPTIQTYNGGRVEWFLEDVLSRQLSELCQQQKVTLFMLMLAGLNTLLYRYTNQNDVIIGTPVAGREHQDLEGLIGFFVNTVVLRTRLWAELPFADLLQQVKTNTLRAYEHQGYPFDLLLEDLDLVRDPSHSPLFDVMLVKIDEKGQSGRAGKENDGNGLSMRIPVSKFDLTLSFTETPQGIGLSIEYNTDLFDSGYIERMKGHYERLLTAIVLRPATPISELDYISAGEKKDLLYTFNTPKTDSSTDHTLVELFEQIVEKFPDRIALVWQDRQLSYRELNDRAGQLAQCLLEQYHIRPDQPVGLLTDSSGNMIIALMGILKSGGAYVPIDQDFPVERKEYIIRETDMKVLVTQSAYLADLDFYRGGHVLLDVVQTSSFPANLIPAKKPVGAAIRNHDLAYIIYTSGSTGTPKGVMVSHASVADYFYGLASRTNIRSCRSFGLFSTIATDLGNTVIYASLLTGGTLFVFTKDEVMDPQKAINSNLDCIKIVPSHWKALQTGQKLFTAAKCLIFGGETLTPDIIALLRTNKADCHIYNHYGPSETTIGKLLMRVDTYDPANTIPIGAPFGNTSVYIVSDRLRLQPVGIAGEICLSGAGLARGYWNQPELTAAKFIPNPFVPGERMYKTGDLGRWLSDGNIEFIGRQDDQIKIRGYRIELREVEIQLLTHVLVDSAIVIARDSPAGEKELVAYIVGSAGLENSALRDYLAKSLPSYMLPAYFVHLPQLPLTSNGKVDKKQLPDPQIQLNKADPLSFTPVERRLVQIWETVLKKKGIGLDDNFFEIGGHSLKAIQLMAHINKELTLTITPRSILLYPTIRSFVSSLIPEKTKNGLVITLNKVDEHKPNVFFLPPVIGTSLVYLSLAGLLDQEYNCYGLQNKGFDYAEPFDDSVEKAASSFAPEILKIQPSGEMILCGYSSGVVICFELSKLLEKEGMKVMLVLLDRGPADTTRYSAEQADFNKDFDHWIGVPLQGLGFGEEQVDRIRGLWFNNLIMATSYQVSGVISGDIIAFESEGHTNKQYTYMESWKSFTSGGLRHFFLEGGHDDILNPQNVKIIADHLNTIKKQRLNGKCR